MTNGQKRRTRRSVGTIFLWGLLLLAAGRSGAQSEPAAIAATVNGDIITVAEFYARMQTMRAQDFLVSVNPLQARPETAGILLLNDLINKRLILQWAAKTKDLPSESEIQAELDALEKQPNVQQALASHFFSEDNLRYDLRVQRARYNIATAALSITPAELDAYYKKNAARYGTPERWGLADIRTTRRSALPKIEDALRAGKPFAAVAKEFSDDLASKDKGGSLGVINAADPGLPASLRDAVKKLKTGEVTPPVKVVFPQGSAWYFVRLTSREPATLPPLDSVRKQVEQQALLERAGGYAATDKKISEFRQSAKIEINLPGYQSLLPKK